MAEIAIVGDKLIVQLRGWEQVWALKRRIEVPLACVRRAVIDPAIARRPEGMRAPGTYLPWVISAGTYRGRGKRAFWSVRNPAKAVVIDLAGHHYTRLVIEVDDPLETVDAIERALERQAH